MEDNGRAEFDLKKIYWNVKWLSGTSSGSPNISVIVPTEMDEKKFQLHLLYYKTLGKLRIRRMFSELIVRSTTYHISLDSAYQGEGY